MGPEEGVAQALAAGLGLGLAEREGLRLAMLPEGLGLAVVLAGCERVARLEAVPPPLPLPLAGMLGRAVGVVVGEALAQAEGGGVGVLLGRGVAVPVD